MKMLMLVLGLLLGAVAGALAWLGAFTAVAVDERDAGPYPFVYVQEASADFGRVGELTKALGERLDKAGFTQRKPAQVYFPQGRGIQNQIGFVVDRPVPYEVLGAETFFRLMPAQRYAAASFPYRNALSFRVGQFRVDPALRDYRAAKKHAETSVMVILQDDTILYLQPIEPG